ncbi:hypothetical protein TREMEDRAFT_31680 [Tremella mesenterica DSM 1558]|uniref:uncharacterized protein n=1 Tax=Tremella mesenterica (strain ATCC 24925 / CBS 8224 / DSM 1558 / NBRC 9311 / NRRL Y-6157 / RJB 2259-6 / UBC 559-6) TaxID=578456 RepID=UPI0003F48D42|nr:uncharacterized protein TREMEDRAFT_31680 [Tremella mesenterica DSM 1558]EIW68593.1 hypothetical protein TREMEDRAFT_31680 [Tremella mesenterica DSM 1558]
MSYIPQHQRVNYLNPSEQKGRYTPSFPSDRQTGEPGYAEPDLDPTLPLTSISNTFGVDMNELQSGEVESGPSRKRSRVEAFKPRERRSDRNEHEYSQPGVGREYDQGDGYRERSVNVDIYGRDGGDGYVGYGQDHMEHGNGNGNGNGRIQGDERQNHGLIIPSIFGISPRNEFTKMIGEFILSNSKGRENVEVEIKLGLLMGPTKSGEVARRVRMPTMTEMIMPPNYPIGPFSSNMTKTQNQSLNRLLNSATESSLSTPFPIRFFRAQHVDSFHEMSGPGRGKVRVSRDKNGNVVEGGCIVKNRIGDLNVYSPQEVFDWRVSVSTEEPVPLPSGPAFMVREKDRACYRHQLVQVDLTVVTMRDDKGKPTLSYEIEIELLDVPTLLAEGEKELSGQPNKFDEILQSFLDTVRMLIRNVE